MQKILIIRESGNIGDLLMLTPALYKLSKNKLIDIFIPKSPKEIFYNLKFINKIYSNYPINKKYDKIINLSNFEYNYEIKNQPNINKSRQELCANLLNVKIENLKPIIQLTNKEINDINNFLINNKIKNKIFLIAPNSTSRTRNWNLDNWKKIAKFYQKDFNVIIIDEKINWKNNKILFFNNRNIRELFALISISNFLLTTDTGPLHIAGSFNIPTLALFGPTDPKVRCIYKNSYYIKSKVKCSPCWYNRCFIPFCMNSITITEVRKKIDQIIS